jgi:bacillithiol biosynthesis deacetylase BshB1
VDSSALKIDVLVICAHPDDAELGCGGTLLKLVSQGKKTGIIDLTKGELGTRGTAETREKEAKAASEILKLSVRENLGLPDGFLANTPEQRFAVIAAIRRWQPEVILTNAPNDRHPDHGNASILVSESAFLSGLPKLATHNSDGSLQAAWRPKKVYHFIQDNFLTPTFCVDISPWIDEKLRAIRAYETQFYQPGSTEPTTWISRPTYLNMIEARARQMGHYIGTEFGEGFVSPTILQKNTPLD